MHLSIKTIALAAVLALSAVPAFALPAQVPSNQGTAHTPSTPGPNASASSKAKAYGKYCSALSKKHVAGQKGTPFSKCVTAMAKLATEQTRSPSKACKSESKKHVDGQKGTPFSRCVVAGAKLLNDKA